MTLKMEVCDWINIFLELDKLKKKYGNSYFNLTLIFLEKIENKVFYPLKEKVILLDLLSEYGINDISIMKLFLEKINCIYDFAKVAKNIELAYEKYGIDSVLLYLNGDSNKRKVKVSQNNYGYRKAYFSKDIIPFTLYDFKHGQMELVLNANWEFIIDDVSSVKRERTFCTDDFGFRSETLPLKEEMNIYDFQKEKFNWMNQLVLNLSYLDQDIEIVVEDIKENNFTLNDGINKKTSILTDGLIYTSDGRLISNPDGYLGQIHVVGADVLLLCTHALDKLQFKLIIDPDYLKAYLGQLESLQERGILSTFLSMFKKDIGFTRHISK